MAMTFEDGYVPFSFNQPDSVYADDPTSPVAKASQQNMSGDALSQLRQLALSNPEYMETYLQLLAERENTTNAQKWYEEMSGSQYQRAMKDLQAAGLNPYLALTGLNGAGSGSVQPSGTWNTSPYSNKVAKENSQSQRMQATAKIAGLLTTSILAIVAMMI